MTPTDSGLVYLVVTVGGFALLMLALAGVCEWLDDHRAVLGGVVWWASFALTWLLLMAERRPRLAVPPLHGRTPSGKSF